MRTLSTFVCTLASCTLTHIASAQTDVNPTPTPAVRESGKPMGTGHDKPIIVLSEPKGGWTASRMLLIKGTVSDASVDPITVSINGEKYLLRTQAGAFSRKFPLSAGKNAVTVSARNAGGASETARSIYASIPASAIKLVLTSDTDHVYTDLHVYEPSQDLKDWHLFDKKYWTHVYWASTESPSGGHFYLNEQSGDFDQPGYGPYLYSHAAPPLGVYRVDANYWPSGDKGTIVGTLDLTLFGGTSNEIKRKVKTPLVRQGQTATLAWLLITKGQKAQVYVPAQDKLTSEQKKAWPAWVFTYVTPKSPNDNDADTF